MPLRTVCPYCRSELNVPKEAVGKVVTCAICQRRFSPSPPGGGETDEPAPPPVSGSAGDPSTSRPGAPQNLEHISMGGGSGAATPIAPSQPPPAATPTPTRPQKQQQTAVTPSPFEPPPTRSSAEPRRPATGPLEHVSMGAKKDMPTAPPVTVPGRKQPKQAKLITTDATQTQVELAADGQLPNLVLSDVETKEKPTEIKSSNPLLIVLAAVFCVGMSLLVMLIPAENARQETSEKTYARRHIEQYYFGEAPLEDYQKTLRAAAAAHHKQEYARERALYKRLLDRLRAVDDNTDDLGVTGIRGKRNEDNEVITDAPNDLDLMEKISILLGN